MRCEMKTTRNSTQIYVDYNSTAPLEDAHLEAVMAAVRQFDGNPSSQHASGRRAKVALEDARNQVAALLGCRAQEVVFTSGATESNNLAIQGVTAKQGEFFTTLPEPKSARLPHVIVGATEHPSVLELVQVLAERGRIRLSIAPVDQRGVILSDTLVSLVDQDTVLVAVMLVNNETGAVQPVAALADAVKAKNSSVHFHTDAVQAMGKIDISWLASSKVDSAAFSGHKIGAFKGIGALYLKAGSKLQAVTLGGGQERARRPGTENVPGIISFGLRARDLVSDPARSWLERDRPAQHAFLGLLGRISGVRVHGDPAAGIANTINFHIEGVAGDDLLLNLDLAG
ncbi:MAG: aminotransferase class V-fold PLP-dependent enzyme, partial [Proteobacteria bacterium]|nr:aminotransferase class V-fold PLP-dependent enzyme [Pseudomonadota bacterium]